MLTMSIASPDRGLKNLEFSTDTTDTAEHSDVLELKAKWLDIECEHDKLLDCVIKRDGNIIFQHLYRRR